MDKDNVKEDQEAPHKTREMVSDDELYRRSSQFRIWSFTGEQLKEKKQAVNEQGQKIATQRFHDAYNGLKNAREDAFKRYPEELAADKLMELVTFEEEEKYLSFYGKNIMQTADFFKMPTQVKATAMSFFKRFYLVHSVMEYHPKNILFTCVFLAAKSENYFISIESFCKALPKTEPKDVLDLEFVLLQGLQFTLLVHHPFRPLHGFFLDFQAVLLYPSPEIYGLTVESLEALYGKSKQWLLEYSVPSDVQFLFTAPQIALAAMYDNDRKVTEKYLRKKILTPKSSDENDKDSNTVSNGNENENKNDDENLSKALTGHYETLLTTIRNCVKIAKQLPKVTREESTPIDKKCIFSLNPTRLIEKKIEKLETMASATATPST